MAKNINVAAHVKRYETTELSDIVALIEGLKGLVEQRRGKTIADMKEKLAILERGELPPVEAKPEKPEGTKRTRGGKKVTEAEA